MYIIAVRTNYFPILFLWIIAFTMIQYAYSDFLPLTELTKKKRIAGSAVSVVIPTLNEASTISAIVASTKKELMEETELIDEIIVIDSNSTDGTQERAEKAGAKVFSIDSIPAPSDPLRGKGVALWKSQFVTRGEIILCIDGDIKNFSTHFIYGLIGPFIDDRHIIFTKAFYRRPFIIDNNIYENYGGRVTEILVRPLLSAFFPELASFHQPLSGEYAFRRGPLETVPFSSGYGVEIGLIFDLFKKYGLDGFAQVNMGMRLHRNRPVQALGKMAFGILRTMVKKLEQYEILTLNQPFHDIMISQRNEGLESTKIDDVELPPKSQIRNSR
jgi:glucosyl-3-phosphoglycerate synthase